MHSSTQASRFAETFDQFIHSYNQASNAENQGLITYFEKGWFSPCYRKLGADNPATHVNENDFVEGEKIGWQAVKRTDNPNLANIESALELSIPAELQQLYGRYYSLDLNAKASYGNLTILQALNFSDFERLQKNLIAHVLMKRRLKQDDTLFFALTDEEDFILSIDIGSGAVVLEEVGKVPQKQISDNLTDFISTLTPQPQLVTL